MRKIISNPKVSTVLMITYFVICLLGEIAALIFLTREPWDVRVGVPLQILAFYGIGLGLVARSKILEVFLAEDMTSHNLFRFIRGNLFFLSLLFSVVGIGLSPRREEGSSPIGCFGVLLLLATFPIIFLYWVFHLAVVMPIAYLGYVVASALVESVQFSGDEMEYTVKSDKIDEKFRVRELIASNPVAAKSFVIGVPAAILSLATKLVALFLST